MIRLNAARIVALCSLAFVFSSCGGGGGDQGRISFELSLQGLLDLGRQRGTYEGFAVLGGVPVSTGKFIVNAAFTPPRVSSPDFERIYGDVNRATFGPSATGLGQSFPFIQDASDFFITIEPELDVDFAPSGNVILVGNFQDGVALLGPIGTTATGGPGLGNILSASGSALLANPTGATDLPENGLWFVQDSAGLQPSLLLPTPTGTWTYEAFVSNGTVTYSLGKFVNPQRRDFDAQISATRGSASLGFVSPGQDFIRAATLGASPLRNLVNGTHRVQITVEPAIDNDPGPFPISILSLAIPSSAVNSSGVSQGELALSNLAGTLPFLVATPAPSQLTLSGRAPTTLGPPSAGTYALWADLPPSGSPSVLVGRFVVSSTLQVTSPDGVVIFGDVNSFTLDPNSTGLFGAFPNVAAATGFFLTQEAFGTAEAFPSDVVLLAGVSDGTSTTLTVAGQSQTAGRGIADFSPASGVFVVETPTDNADGVAPNDGFGIWFRRAASPDLAGLTLPSLPSQYRYEGWVIDIATGSFASTGKFSSGTGPDEDAMTFRGRGTVSTGFPVPGQDFVTAIPGVSVPAGINLTSAYDVFVTLEPFPDTSEDPFSLRLLFAQIPTQAGVVFPLTNVVSAPSGRVEWE